MKTEPAVTNVSESESENGGNAVNEFRKQGGYRYPHRKRHEIHRRRCHRISETCYSNSFDFHVTNASQPFVRVHGALLPEHLTPEI